jgi:DUF1680 family protein
MNLFVILGLCVLIPVCGTAQSRTASREVGSRTLQPFDYRGVTLLDGPLKSQVDEVTGDYLRISEDALLKGFRARAGFPAPGADLGGWYSSDTFHVFGQILSGLARMYAATGDVRCKARADSLLHEWAITIAPDGYFYYSKAPNAPHYTYEKMVGGLVDMMVYCKSTEARAALGRITDWAEKNLSRKRGYAFNSGAGDTEWYTLSENLYRAYLATGDERYKKFAAVWEYTEYWDIYASKGDIFAKRPNGESTGGYHAYSHVNTLSGLGAAYLVTGERRYMETLSNAYDYLQQYQCFATGGYGPNELLAPRDALVRMLGDTHNTFETQCGSWAGFKVSKYLITCTGDAKYGDWIERLILNGIGAGISMTPEGRVFYYSDYNTGGGFKKNIETPWTCCTGTRPQAVADYADLAYFHSADTLYVNLFTPSTVQWKPDKATFTVKQETRFPEQAETTLTVVSAGKQRLTLAIRVPGWLAGPITARLGSDAIPLTIGTDHWARISRKWRSGDRLTISVPMKVRTFRFDPARPYPAAVMVGPVALALESANSNTSRLLRAINVATALRPVAGKPLWFDIDGHREVIARPFYTFREGEPYTLYIDPAAPSRLGYRTLKFSDGWNDSGAFRFINRIGATVEATFEIPPKGGGIRWLGFKYDDAGRAEVRIDGEVVAIVDQFGPGRDLPFDWRKTDLAPGKHNIKLTLLPDKTEASKDHYINVAGFEVLENE